MKHLNTFNRFINEGSDDHQEWLNRQGMSKTTLSDSKEIEEKIDELIFGDEELKRLLSAAETRLAELFSKFEAEYEWDEFDMYAAAESWREYRIEGNDSELDFMIGVRLFNF